MEINYQETSKDLLTRIDIHETYGSANIDVWTNELLQPQAGMNILDVGCGAGKLSFLFDDYTQRRRENHGRRFLGRTARQSPREKQRTRLED
jgi:ubiquinone/menaquinone biosynthesis C-methylase UbiE